MAHKDQFSLMKAKDPEAEITGLEKFEAELKNIIYGMSYLMLKQEQESTLQLFAIFFIQACQLLSLVFNASINYPWKGYMVETGFKSFFKTFQIVYWLEYSSWTVFLIVFYIAVGIIAIVCINIGYSGYRITNKKTAVMWPLRLLRFALEYLSTIFFMPFNCILLY